MGNKEILKGNRAEYGKQILATVSQQLTAEYGRGASERNLAYMIRFNEAFPQVEILQTLCAKLSWSHFKNLVLSHNPDFKLIEFSNCGIGCSTIAKQSASQLEYELPRALPEELQSSLPTIEQIEAELGKDSNDE